MTSLESRCLDSFPEWLRALSADARALSAALSTSDNEVVRRQAAASLIYLTKSLDLIFDGLEELGYLDDAFVVRVASAAIAPADLEAESSGILQRLANDTELIREFLGEDYARLEQYVQSLVSASARGRSVEAVLNEEEVRASLGQEVRAWADEYVPPAFARDPKTLVKLRSFLKNKLP